MILAKEDLENKNNKKRNKKKDSFTLVELLVVLAIIGGLSVMVFSNISSSRLKAQIAKAKSDIKQVYRAITLLENDSNEWPGHQLINTIGSGGGNEICGEPGCNFSLSDNESGIVTTDGNYPCWSGPYMTNIPLDPWGKEYFFDSDYQIWTGSSTTTVVAIGSFGPNMVGVNLYDNDDIIYILYTE
jgi:general secretion pathway protein G